MGKKLLTLIFIGFTGLLSAQPTWSEDAAAVFYNKCTECHNPEGVGTFSLMEYPTAYEYRSLIASYVEFNIMPPWSADSSFQHYFDERTLTTYERNTIIDWANGGALEGDPTLAPPPPVYSAGQSLPGVPDLVVEMPNYMSKATSEYDDYICISLPTGLTEDRRVKAIEIIPGNASIVHHCLVYTDLAGTYPTDTIGGDCGGPSAIPLMAGYTPGARPTIFPSSVDFSSGVLMGEGSNVVFALHYPHGSYGEFDQTKVHFYFYDEPIDNFREITAAPFLSNWDFVLPANEETAVSADPLEIPIDLTVLGTFPHMHLLGKSIETYGIEPSGDTIPFIRIPEWDFDWQDFYWFRFLQKIPAGSSVYANGVYDNTTANPHNPSSPPEEVVPGSNTTDEMFLIYFHAMLYEPGDEFVNVDSLNNLYLLGNAEFTEIGKQEIKVYPNPFNEKITVEYSLSEDSYVSVYIYDMTGKVINELYAGKQQAGMQSMAWDGTNTEGSSVAKGMYYYSMRVNGKPYSGRIIKQ